MAFGRATGPKSLILYFSVNPQLPPDVKYLEVRVDSFRRSDDARLNARIFSAKSGDQDDLIQAFAKPDGREIRLEVCFGRQGGRLGNPGTYSGSVTLTDLRLASDVSVPVTVTLQYTHGAVLLWLILLVAVPGTWLLWLTKRPDTNSDESALNWDWLTWLKTVGGVIATATGTVAAFSVYVATYLKDPTWGTSPYQLIGLYGAMFSAFVATSGIAHASAQRIQFQPTHDTTRDAKTGQGETDTSSQKLDSLSQPADSTVTAHPPDRAS
jgi:hypothetical protein